MLFCGQMVDVVDKTTRSRMMSGIRDRDTAPERIVRKALSAAGFRYRLHVKGLPGRPDIVLHQLRTVVQIHGCFWHHHRNCRYAYVPKSRVNFWIPKLKSNVLRDKRNKAELKRLGWRVITVWECAATEKKLGALIKRLRLIKQVGEH
jgi:DNA mismatch endonuclease (patch repair protein)